MDDIYSDLENYNEVNVIDELREENKELKFKLEEYASNIDKLQKDFDKLSCEYKKLEINYSSLLKTAKKEIERKTQIISNLNVEKDMMVLNSLQNSNKNILNIRRNMTRDVTNSFKMNKKDNNSGDRNKNLKDLPETKKCDPERNEDNRMASIDTISSVNTDEMNITNIEKPRKLESYSDKNSEGKENITTMKSRPQSIRNRRKSMPAVSQPCAKISSDEEFERNYPGEGRLFKDWPTRDDTRRSYNDKLIHKVSETSGIDEKYSSYHESSRETYYKGKPNRFSDKYRIRDKYDPSQRYRRHFSPERQHRRVQRDHSDDRFQRPEYRRQRVLESPPDRYESQRKNRDRRSNYERENYHDERQRHHHERYAVKHKNLSDYDEPNSKRARTESYGRPLEEDVRWHTHIEVTEQPALSRMVDNMQDISCQSPDYILADTFSAQPIREIMYTAATQLEDPRLTSTNYVVTSNDDKVVVSTVTGRNVHLKVVDKSTWKIERVDIPDALQRPPQYTDEHVKQMYMDIDNPASNMSMESGEIQSNHSETNYVPLGDVVTESLFNDYEKERSKDFDVRGEKIIDFKEKHVQSSSSDNPVKPTKYKIPKVKHKDKSSEPSEVRDLANPLCKLLKEMSGSDTKNEGSVKRNKTDSKKARQHRVQPENITSERDKVLENKKNYQSFKTSTAHELQTTLSNREIVEGDLELSDETSDYVVKPKLNPKTITVEKSTRVHKSKTHKDSQKALIVDNIEKDKKLCQAGFDEIKTNKVSVQVKVERSISEADDSIPETDKKKKTIRKTQKSKGTNDKESQSTELKKTTEKKKRSKKEKETKIKDLKPKFSDLFGDSSTVDLITPSDLGIPDTESQSQPSKYLPIFEDAQDAIDVNVDEIGKPETVLTKVDNPVVDASQCSHKVEDLKFEINNAKKVSTEKVSEKSDDAEIVPTGEIVKTQKIYENLDIEMSCKEPDVVKTVIISTGIQPQSIYNSDVTLNHEQVNNLLDKLPETQNKILSKVQEAPQALATSTPYKNLLLANVNVDKDIKIPESNCNSSDSRALGNDDSATIDQSSASNGLDSQNDNTDVPDVRIFVRRRRKIVKK